jgi:hypothetical protein
MVCGQDSSKKCVAIRFFHAILGGCVQGLHLKEWSMVKVARKIRLEHEGNDLGYWLSRPPLERLRALGEMRRMYIEAYVAPGKQRLERSLSHRQTQRLLGSSSSR